MARYTDPRRPTNITPTCIRNGVLICERIEEGRYTHQDENFDHWAIERRSGGSWSYRKRTATEWTNHYATKRDAVRALQVQVYGAYTLEKDYSR